MSNISVRVLAECLKCKKTVSATYRQAISIRGVICYWCKAMEKPTEKRESDKNE